jgi:uncharacterized protein (TIGR02588 family)
LARDDRGSRRRNASQQSVKEREPDGSRSGERERPKGRSAAEWTTLIVSVLVIAIIVGAALYEHFANGEPPGVQISVDVAIDRIDTRDGQNYVPFTVTNVGADPAQDVVVIFEIKQGDDTVEESTTDIAFLPNSGSVEGELVTALDLSAHTIEARVATFQIP